MTERDLETRLRDAYRAEAARIDPGALSERVHSIPAMVEAPRLRWWHRLRHGASRQAGYGGTQVRGATTMLAATRVAAIVATLALGTTYLAVQIGDRPGAGPQPGAPTVDDWAVVTGTQQLLDSSSDCALAGQNLDMSDPRFEGDLCINFETIDGEDVATFWSSVTVTNADGSWHGHSVGFVDEEGGHHHTSWFEGAGAYEGLALLEQLTEANPAYPSAGTDLDIVGLIYAGELPPMVRPEWVAPLPEEEEGE